MKRRLVDVFLARTEDRVTLTYESTSKFAIVNGINLHYHEAGHGQPVIGIHGGGPGGNGWTNFELNMAPLAEQFRVLLIDLPGFGESANPPRTEPVLAFYARWVHDFAESLGLSSVDLIGNSLGGATSLRLALDFPDLVRRMVLVGPAGGYQTFEAQGQPALYVDYYDEPSKERLLPWLYNMVYDPDVITEEMIDHRYRISVRDEILTNPAMMPWVRIAQREIGSRLHEIPHSTLITWGRDDRAIGFDAGIFMLQQLQNADLLIFSKCGHWVQRERAEEFDAAVKIFLSL